MSPCPWGRTPCCSVPLLSCTLAVPQGLGSAQLLACPHSRRGGFHCQHPCCLAFLYLLLTVYINKLMDFAKDHLGLFLRCPWGAAGAPGQAGVGCASVQPPHVCSGDGGQIPAGSSGRWKKRLLGSIDLTWGGRDQMWLQAAASVGLGPRNAPHLSIWGAPGGPRGSNELSVPGCYCGQGVCLPGLFWEGVCRQTCLLLGAVPCMAKLGQSSSPLSGETEQQL